MRQFIKSIAYSSKTIRVLERLEEDLPYLRQWHRMQYQRHFEKALKWERIFSGVYPDFRTAQSHIPKNLLVGYDNPETATFLGRKCQLLPSEYPVLFWLSRLFQDNHSIFDFGGYIGILYNTYRQFNIYPQNLQWTVYDVPAVIAAGQQILDNDPDPSLKFTCDVADAASASILLAAGSLQYSEPSIAEILSGLRQMPEHLLINKLPTTKLPSFFTLQNMGPAVSPYKVVRRIEFVQSLETLGYRLIDGWKNPDLSCYIPFHPDHAVEEFDGFYFARQVSALAL
ncbi:MAG: methyltransferase, TIGR04325 family [Granulicella sp.]